jgi:ABC-2 type transport system permease protein
MGFSLLISALNVFYEDVKYVVGIITYLLFFMCPVMYSSEMVYYKMIKRPHGHALYVLYNLNPIAVLVSTYKKILLAPQPQDGQAAIPINWHLLGIATGVSLFILWYGYRVFNRLKWRFVERV